MTPDDLRRALPLLDGFVERFAPLLGPNSRVRRVHAYLRGLLLDNADNKTAEAIALKVHGDPSQVRMTQVFLAQSPWKDAPLRDELANWVASELATPDGILIIDETSFPKCGDKSVGVARQYCGESGKIENCQVAVYAAYSGTWGHTLLDTRLYLPEEEWANAPQRRLDAGVPEDVDFHTKPELALELVTHLGAILPHAWVTFDEAYGRDGHFLNGLESLGERYIGELPKSARFWLESPPVQLPGKGPTGRMRKVARVDPDAPEPQTAEVLAQGLPPEAWQRLAFREGSKGTQESEFALMRVYPVRDELPGAQVWLMLERSISPEPKWKYYVSNAGLECPLLAMATAGHRRYPVEECFLRGKDELGQGDYEVQGWRGWHHHQTLVMLSMWFLLLWGRELGKKTSEAK